MGDEFGRVLLDRFFKRGDTGGVLRDVVVVNELSDKQNVQDTVE